MVTEVVWWVFAVAIVAAASGVVFSRAVTHAAIFFIGSLGGVAAMYILLQNEFLALVQVLIYGGAVAVLLLLALMVTRQTEAGRRLTLTGDQWPFGLVAAASIGAIAVAVAVDAAWPGDTNDEATGIGISQVSDVLFNQFGVPFLIASALLLVALVGAIMLGRAEDPE